MPVPSRPLRIVAGLVLCAACGALLAWVHFPLPWMIGSMVGMAAAQLSGARLATVPGGRDAGMVVVGISLGLYFTPPVVREVSAHWPWFVALGFAAVAFGIASALLLARLSGADLATAYFGSMPGGAADMAMLGEPYGAATDRVALAHSVRMLMVVTVFPVGITLAGFSASDEYRPVVVPFSATGLLVLAALGAVAGAVARRLKLPTAFMMGSLLLTIALTVSGFEFSSVPTPLTNVAQVLLGANLGSRFDRSFLRDAPRFTAALAVSVPVTLGLAAIVGAGLAWGTRAYLGSALLAAAPGGIAEMSITAKVLRLGVAYVTAAHVVRYIIVVLLTRPVYRHVFHRG